MTPDDLLGHPWLSGGLLVGLSAVTLVVSALALPRVLVRLPADWLTREAPAWRAPSWREVLPSVARNALGAVLIAGGLLMLVLPGQGLLTLLAGLVLVDVPGKRRVIARLLRVEPLGDAVTWVRRRAGVPPLELPEDDGRSG